jgi:hypothetical protein
VQKADMKYQVNAPTVNVRLIDEPIREREQWLENYPQISLFESQYEHVKYIYEGTDEITRLITDTVESANTILDGILVD